MFYQLENTACLKEGNLKFGAAKNKKKQKKQKKKKTKTKQKKKKPKKKRKKKVTFDGLQCIEKTSSQIVSVNSPREPCYSI